MIKIKLSSTGLHYKKVLKEAQHEAFKKNITIAESTSYKPHKYDVGTIRSRKSYDSDNETFGFESNATRNSHLLKKQIHYEKVDSYSSHKINLTNTTFKGKYCVSAAGNSRNTFSDRSLNMPTQLIREVRLPSRSPSKRDTILIKERKALPNSQSKNHNKVQKNHKKEVYSQDLYLIKKKPVIIPYKIIDGEKYCFIKEGMNKKYKINKNNSNKKYLIREVGSKIKSPKKERVPSHLNVINSSKTLPNCFQNVSNTLVKKSINSHLSRVDYVPKTSVKEPYRESLPNLKTQLNSFSESKFNDTLLQKRKNNHHSSLSSNRLKPIECGSKPKRMLGLRGQQNYSETVDNSKSLIHKQIVSNVEKEQQSPVKNRYTKSTKDTEIVKETKYKKNKGKLEEAELTNDQPTKPKFSRRGSKRTTNDEPSTEALYKSTKKYGNKNKIYVLGDDSFTNSAASPTKSNNADSSFSSFKTPTKILSPTCVSSPKECLEFIRKKPNVVLERLPVLEKFVAENVNGDILNSSYSFPYDTSLLSSSHNSSKHSEQMNVSKTLNSSKHSEDLNISNSQNSSKHSELMNVSKSCNSSKGLEDLNISKSLNSSKGLEDLNVSKSLNSYKDPEDLNVSKSLNSSKGPEDLNVNNSLNLFKGPEDLNVNKSHNSSKGLEDLNVNNSHYLSKQPEALNICNSDNLSRHSEDMNLELKLGLFSDDLILDTNEDFNLFNLEEEEDTMDIKVEPMNFDDIDKIAQEEEICEENSETASTMVIDSFGRVIVKKEVSEVNEKANLFTDDSEGSSFLFEGFENSNPNERSLKELSQYNTNYDLPTSQSNIITSSPIRRPKRSSVLAKERSTKAAESKDSKTKSANDEKLTKRKRPNVYKNRKKVDNEKGALKKKGRKKLFTRVKSHTVPVNKEDYKKKVESTVPKMLPIQYKCKFCSFSTRWKPTLLLHSKKHGKENSYSKQAVTVKSSPVIPPMVKPTYGYPSTGKAPANITASMYDPAANVSIGRKASLYSAAGKTGRSLPPPPTKTSNIVNAYTNIQFHCKLCPFKALTSGNLFRHIRTHKGFIPYQCMVCKMCFSDSETLKAHIADNHTNSHEGNTRKYNCYTCFMNFPFKAALENHKRIHHEEEKISCPICEIVCKDKVTLKHHLKSHTSEDCIRLDQEKYSGSKTENQKNFENQNSSGVNRREEKEQFKTNKNIRNRRKTADIESDCSSNTTQSLLQNAYEEDEDEIDETLHQNVNKPSKKSKTEYSVRKDLETCLTNTSNVVVTKVPSQKGEESLNQQVKVIEMLFLNSDTKDSHSISDIEHRINENTGVKLNSIESISEVIKKNTDPQSDTEKSSGSTLLQKMTDENNLQIKQTEQALVDSCVTKLLDSDALEFDLESKNSTITRSRHTRRMIIQNQKKDAQSRNLTQTESRYKKDRTKRKADSQTEPENKKRKNELISNTVNETKKAITDDESKLSSEIMEGDENSEKKDIMQEKSLPSSSGNVEDHLEMLESTNCAVTKVESTNIKVNREIASAKTINREKLSSILFKSLETEACTDDSILHQNKSENNKSNKINTEFAGACQSSLSNDLSDFFTANSTEEFAVDSDENSLSNMEITDQKIDDEFIFFKSASSVNSNSSTQLATTERDINTNSSKITQQNAVIFKEKNKSNELERSPNEENKNSSDKIRLKDSSSLSKESKDIHSSSINSEDNSSRSNENITEKLTNSEVSDASNNVLCFKCNFCSFKADKRYILNKHLEDHSNMRPFECSFCPHTFSNPGDLKMHIKEHDDDDDIF